MSADLVVVADDLEGVSELHRLRVAGIDAEMAAADPAAAMPTRPSLQPHDKARWLMVCEAEPRLPLAGRREPGWWAPVATDTSASAADFFICCRLLEAGFEPRHVVDCVHCNRKLHVPPEPHGLQKSIGMVAKAMAKVGAR